MIVERINKIRKSVKENSPLIHCITNPISINQCANAVLAVGGRPIMAEHPKEVKEITLTSKALLLNLGNITDSRMKSILISAEVAKENKIPFTVDLVGIACSELRYDFAKKLTAYLPSVLKGNYSEINAIYNPEYRSLGVDADLSLDTNNVCKASVSVARKYNCTVIASGKTDIITDGKRVIYIKNGTYQLATVTGTGCILGALLSTYLSQGSAVDAAVTACAVLGICGELSETKNGSGSFMVNLMDKLSSLTDVINHIKMEEF